MFGSASVRMAKYFASSAGCKDLFDGPDDSCLLKKHVADVERCYAGIARAMAEKRRRVGVATRNVICHVAFAAFVLVGALFSVPRCGNASAVTAPQVWTLDTYNVESPAATHGLLKKNGPLGVLAMAGSGRTYEELCYPVPWREARLRGVKERLPAKCSSIMFNDKYKLIYVKCPKTAGNTLVSYFIDCSHNHAADRCLQLLDFNNATMVSSRLKLFSWWF